MNTPLPVTSRCEPAARQPSSFDPNLFSLYGDPMRCWLGRFSKVWWRASALWGGREVRRLVPSAVSKNILKKNERCRGRIPRWKGLALCP